VETEAQQLNEGI